jgi:3-mercaptopyruvate sulfurtransferase SseA
MYKGMLKNKKFRLAPLLGAVAIVFLVLWGCGGGTSSYDNPKAEYLSGNAESSLIDVDTLRRWDANEGVLDDGLYKTDKGERVVLIDATDTKDSMVKYYLGVGHLPGALVNLAHENGEAMIRNDGPIAEDHDVADGPSMDKLMRSLGITKDAVVVITTSKIDMKATRTDPANVLYDFCASRLLWTMKYWGFSSAKVKILNGFNGAWKAAGYPLVKTNTPAVTPSTFSVRELPGVNASIRYSIGQMIRLVDSGKANKLAGDVIILDTRQPLAGFTEDSAAQAVTSTGGSAFDGIVRGAVTIKPTDPISNWNIIQEVKAADGTNLGIKWRTKAELKAAFDAVGIKGDKPIIVYCNSGSSTTRYWYPLAEILGYNVSVFDASMQMWQTMSAFQPGDLTYVRYDSTSANYANSKFFYWDPTQKQFIDNATKLPVAAGAIKSGGNMRGDTTWDTVTRSERVTFRPTSTVNSAATFQTYNALGSAGVANVDQDWRPVVVDPLYRGTGSQTLTDDVNYYNGTSSSGAPVGGGGNTGGGC